MNSVWSGSVMPKAAGGGGGMLNPALLSNAAFVRSLTISSGSLLKSAFPSSRTTASR